MQVSFDNKKFINDVIIAINVEMDKVAEILIQFMIGEISGMSTNAEDSDMSQWKLNVINALHWRAVASAGQIVREVGILDQSNPGLIDEALSIEFGTGTKMNDSANPWYNEFLSSEYYHTSRQGKEIYSLPGEKVFDPESGTWADSTATNRVAMPQFAQEGALYWTSIFGNSAIMAETYFNQAINKAIDSIDFSKYLIVK